MSDEQPAAERLTPTGKKSQLMQELPPMLQPERLSREQPRLTRHNQKYTGHQVAVALRLARDIGVDAAAKACGVSRWAIYRAGARPARNLDPRYEVRIKIPPMAKMQKAVRLALYWGENIEAARSRYYVHKSAGTYRECVLRAAVQCSINPIVTWEQFMAGKIEGCPFDPKIHKR